MHNFEEEKNKSELTVKELLEKIKEQTCRLESELEQEKILSRTLQEQATRLEKKLNETQARIHIQDTTITEARYQICHWHITAEQSETTGKAGGLKCEPLKAVY